MTIYKILNNNLILSKDKQGHEIIVKGCGIAFQKKKGQQVDETLIEKIFTAETAQISKEIQGYFASIPEKYLDFVEAYVNEVKEKQGLELNDSIYFSLSDHIMGAISRLNQGIQIQNMLLLDIKQLYHKAVSYTHLYIISYLNPSWIHVGVNRQAGVAEFFSFKKSGQKQLENDAAGFDMSIGDYLFSMLADSESNISDYLEFDTDE